MITRISKNTFIFILILFLAFLFRVYGISWDFGFHFHPDERMLIMVADRIRFWSQMNPDFFNYGSLPVYLLVAISQLIDRLVGTTLTNYDGLLLVGRWISLFADLIVLILVYKISANLFQKKAAALWSAFFYAVAFFPIQNSHFFIVDIFLNLFSTLLIYQLLIFQNNPSYRRIVLIGITFAAAITSKISAVIFLPVILLVLLYPHPKHENILQRILHFFQKKIITSRQRIHTIFKKDVFRIVLFGMISVAFSAIFMPYAFIEHEQFTSDIQQQLKMNSNAYIFPYTLQYVGTLPYWYYMKNIILWGLGPIISIFAIVGGVYGMRYVVYSLQIRKQKVAHTIYDILHTKYFLFILFYVLYFLIIGKSAVKFMRYMLLMYPFFAVMAGYGIYKIQTIKIVLYRHKINLQPFTKLFVICFSVLTILWTLPFIMIYSVPNTRIRASKWINQFIPYGSTLGVEHWDDRVPIFDPGNYKYEELTLYDIPDDQNKIALHYRKLQHVDYIVIASNRLYTPLQKLTDCTKNERCYPATAKYYQDLFEGRLGFVKIAEFTSYPRIQIFNLKIQLIDDTADESFTVYDHPKIMIFKKI